MDIKKLLSQMTLEEKIGQLLQCGTSIYKDSEEVQWDMLRAGKIGSFLYIRDPEVANKIQHIAVEETRLGIPVIFADDVVHGFFTTFPTPAAEACSWEPELSRRTAECSARESRANGIQWNFMPMVDIARDARWGRNVEGAGEDPYLGSLFASARVKGYQGDDISKPDRMAACAKHFIGYSGCEGGREYNSVEMSEQTLYNVYLPPFQATVDAGVATFMTAFHDLNGIPCTGNKRIMTELLRNEMNFDGVLVSDARSVGILKDHGFTSDDKESAYKSMDAGVDIEMSTFTYNDHMKELVESGKISMQRLDEAVLRVLKLKDDLGLFENPYTDPEKANEVRPNEKSIALAREAARKSIVLMKNDGTLPLSKKSKILLVGELADSEDDMNGAWKSGRQIKAVTVKEAFETNGFNMKYVKGYDFESGEIYPDEVSAAAKECDVILYVAGEKGNMAGEAYSRASVELPKFQQKLFETIKNCGKPVVLYAFSGRPLALRNEYEAVEALVWSGHLGAQAGNAVCDVLFGDYNPSARLVWTFPTSDGQSPYYYNQNTMARFPRDGARFCTKYIDAPINAQFPFGYGLSYSEFEYSNLKLSSDEYSGADDIKVSVDVKNISEIDGEETVQVYVHDKVASMIRPVKELKAFEKVFIKSGETKTVELTIPVSSLGFYNIDMKYVVEPGDFDIYVGCNADSGLKTELMVV